jgi:hypothetical protein
MPPKVINPKGDSPVEIRRALAETRRIMSTHTHTKAQITDLETITATPTASAVPKADANGVLHMGWLPPLTTQAWMGI